MWERVFGVFLALEDRDWMIPGLMEATVRALGHGGSFKGDRPAVEVDADADAPLAVPGAVRVTGE